MEGAVLLHIVGSPPIWESHPADAHVLFMVVADGKRNGSGLNASIKIFRVHRCPMGGMPAGVGSVRSGWKTPLADRPGW